MPSAYEKFFHLLEKNYLFGWDIGKKHGIKFNVQPVTDILNIITLQISIFITICLSYIKFRKGMNKI